MYIKKQDRYFQDNLVHEVNKNSLNKKFVNLYF